MGAGKMDARHSTASAASFQVNLESKGTLAARQEKVACLVIMEFDWNSFRAEDKDTTLEGLILQRNDLLSAHWSFCLGGKSCLRKHTRGSYHHLTRSVAERSIYIVLYIRRARHFVRSEMQAQYCSITQKVKALN